ncbi:site-2 protease family protein [Halobacteria archaeon HArc-gm2]|nr:site-2 protease family protein [Halobacteria archaeon HArc-gm2]
MVSTLTWVLAGLVGYSILVMALRTRGLLPESVKVSGPITTIHTKRGREFLDWAAQPKRFWRAWGNLGIGIALVVMAGAFVAVLFAGYQSAIQPAAQPVQNPQNILVIPGVNDFLPLSATPEIVFGLALGLVIHEGGHGLLCRVEDIKIDSMGLALLTVVPLGAFVEPDEEDRAQADRGAQTRMFAAGVTNNFAISIVAFILLFGPVAGSIAVVDGVTVGDAAPGSSAAEAGLEHGDVVTEVAGTPVANASEMERVLGETDDRNVTIRLASGEQKTVERRLVITRAVPSAVPGIDLDGERPPQVLAVNGSEVHTERGFHRAVANRSIAEIETDSGSSTVPVGAYVAQVTAGGPLGGAGAPTDGTPVVVTQIGGERVPNATALSTVLDGHEPGDTATVVAHVDGERRSYDVTFTEGDDGGARLGVFPRAGTTGLTVDDLGIHEYPASGFLQAIGGGGDFLGGLSADRVYMQIQFMLVSPFLSLIQPGAVFNFAGFTGGVENFYRAAGPLGFLGGGVIALANVLFWTAWINFQIALFNCIPTFPLDGGHILRTSTEAIVSRLPIEGKRSVATAITGTITITMIAALILMIFGPQLLS